MSTLDEQDRKWILNLVKANIKHETPLEGEKGPPPITVKPKTKIQGIIFEFFEALKYADGNADCLDKFYENVVEDYKAKHHLASFLWEISKGLHIKITTWPYGEKAYQELFFLIGEAVAENHDNLLYIEDAINTKWPRLVTEMAEHTPRLEPDDPEAYNKYVDDTLKEIEENLRLNTWRDNPELKAEVEKIRRAKETTVENVARRLNEIIMLGEDTWELLIYACLSPMSPRIPINGLEVRANLHAMLIGDISTAKSRAFSILKLIAPKWTIISKTTEASMEGIVKKDIIEEGLLEKANDGIFLVPEFRRSFQRIQILREAMDCESLMLYKRGIGKPIDVNTTFIAGANPRDDFFQTDKSFRSQIPFKEGLLSRFDILIPLTASTEMNERILYLTNIFGPAKLEVNFSAIKEVLQTLSAGMKDVQGVTLTEDQKTQVRIIFLAHNIELKNRPLLVMRDFEVLARIINTIVVSNFPHRETTEGIVSAHDEDISKALSLWENMIMMRRQLYRENPSRVILDLDEKILIEIARQGNPKTLDVYKVIVEGERACSKATFYRRIRDMRRKGLIHQAGLKNGVLSIITTTGSFLPPTPLVSQPHEPEKAVSQSHSLSDSEGREEDG